MESQARPFLSNTRTQIIRDTSLTCHSNPNLIKTFEMTVQSRHVLVETIYKIRLIGKSWLLLDWVLFRSQIGLLCSQSLAASDHAFFSRTTKLHAPNRNSLCFII